MSDLRRTLRLGGALLALLAAVSPAAARSAVTLPIFAACTPGNAPELPQRWRAVGLMLPFLQGQVDVGEFVYDNSLPAMRATVYGLESGAADLLITKTETYQIIGPSRAPTGCVALGPKYTPSNAWMKTNAACIGHSPLAGRRMLWWKSAAADGRVQWHVFREDTQLPWRIVLPMKSADPPVIGDYAMTYFPSFTAVNETNLSKLRDFCVAHAKKGSSTAASVRDLMSGNPAAEAERETRVATLVPGLSHNACSGLKPPRWPDQFLMTATLAPIPYKWAPLPSVVYYDWPGAKSQIAVMHVPWATPPVRATISALKKDIGYSVLRTPTGPQCIADIPGLVRPDWMTSASCTCKGVIDNNPELSPGEKTQILSCPIKEQGQRLMWTWYTTAGRPVLFFEPGAVGNGLNVADYHQWMPGMTLPAVDYELPAMCANPQNKGLPASATTSCVDCHTTGR